MNFATADELVNALGVGLAVLVILAGLVFAYLKTIPPRSHHATPTPSVDKAGERSVEYWQNHFREIESDLERLLVAVQDTKNDQGKMNEILRDRLHTIIELLSRIDTIVSERTGYPARRKS